MDHGFNETYYATVAVVIPVFFLAAIAPDYFQSDTEDSFSDSAYLAAVVLVALTGEAIALWALAHHATPARIENLIITLGFLFPASFVGVGIASGPIGSLWNRLPSSMRRGPEPILVLLILGCLVLILFFNVKPVTLATYFALAFIVAMAIPTSADMASEIGAPILKLLTRWKQRSGRNPHRRRD
jgi:hypothetical protein